MPSRTANITIAVRTRCLSMGAFTGIQFRDIAVLFAETKAALAGVVFFDSYLQGFGIKIRPVTVSKIQFAVVKIT